MPIRTYYKLDKDTETWLEGEVKKLVQGGFVEPILESQWLSMAIAPVKKDEFGRPTLRRFCINFKPLNKVTVKDTKYR